MPLTDDPVALREWVAIGRRDDFPPPPSGSAPGGRGRVLRTRLLGGELIAYRDAQGRVQAGPPAADGTLARGLAVRERYGHVWTTWSDDPRPMIEMPEFDEPDRRLVAAGAVTVRTSAQRLVENFLDMGHFPYVHTGILGDEPGTEVKPYEVETIRELAEVHARRCRFFQPQAAKSAQGGIEVEYHYRTSGPFVVMLYKTSPPAPGRQDLIGLFLQPMEEDHCEVHSFVLVIDPDTPDVDLLHFQQVIFLQDRLIVEQQVPRRLPLWQDTEMPTRADASASAYRRWMREVGMRFGCEGGPPARPAPATAGAAR